VLPRWLLAIGPKENSPACSRDCCKVADRAVSERELVTRLGVREFGSGADGPNRDLCLLAASKRYPMAKLRLVAKAVAERGALR
jgi:hypothetical protein